MPSSTLYTKENEILTQLMREMRIAAGLTQAACSEALAKPQSYVSKIEGGSQRIDLLQLRQYCLVCGVSLTTFVKRFESKTQPNK
ncbi:MULTISPECIES: helix-turn-helix transcriptional regulator [unclassified Lysobacter]|uniref:helix-turn-helix domain-containing protein n=1 Tax=unclassified Lysobacter TaxID=2635362 RepID=UPI001BE627E0|nr:MULTISPECIES: helix-turn-helix transcriptional regulator [unclassified Lysobacter]MBT2746590.1 helix-turn-helix transcriptional regulator [Lysobacter sp. ISL-42]MBT2753415.1 helix-turn-helix transcriptional regulator [Lysobacter sp. ISL-50]MBT2775525.1 helix-turn-helix transcriptional regulator [Lysobacter sp. ISL-54]MBT2782939.1 helix-turn-helix transcriptional regulator [Lysobacter sp. ISL-52]